MNYLTLVNKIQYQLRQLSGQLSGQLRQLRQLRDIRSVNWGKNKK